jgi:hypothetical protein
VQGKQEAEDHGRLDRAAALKAEPQDVAPARLSEVLAQPLERLDGDGILKAGQRGLTGQVLVLRRAVGDQFEDRSARRVSWSFWSS